MNSHRIRKYLSISPFAASLFTDHVDCAYFTGIDLEGYWLLLSHKGSRIFAPPLLADHVRSLVKGMPVEKGDSVLESLFDYCRKISIKMIGIDQVKTGYYLGQRLGRKLKLENAGHLLDQLRQVKDQDEIKAIKKSCKIAVKAIGYAQRITRPGMTEEEIAFKIDEFYAKNMVKPSFTTIVASGPNSANPHHLSSSRKVRQNDIVLIDTGCVFKGYCSDLTRTFFLGKMNDLKRQVYTLVDKARLRAIQSLKAGQRACDADRIARDIITGGGYGDRFIHTTGHGLGREVHESPRIGPKDRTVLQAGMAITIEPGVYLPNSFGVRIEDTVLVTRRGYEVLTR